MRIYSSGKREETVVLPGSEASVGEGRRWLRKVLVGHARRDDAVLVLSELLTNGVVHSRSAELRASVLVEWDGSIHLKVADQGT
ncbi:ATP-binding protein [Sphaerisporangium aureirubrum]|uniref:ATP-binding protein n=1 Tax=Sphaerisporangium aureirubrum TaxID=1544736 RepID=A0ABW1NW44_9ACTN